MIAFDKDHAASGNRDKTFHFFALFLLAASEKVEKTILFEVQVVGKALVVSINE
jgi:hypothetical protein